MGHNQAQFRGGGVVPLTLFSFTLIKSLLGLFTSSPPCPKLICKIKVLSQGGWGPLIPVLASGVALTKDRVFLNLLTHFFNVSPPTLIPASQLYQCLPCTPRAKRLLKLLDLKRLLKLLGCGPGEVRFLSFSFLRAPTTL